MALPIPRAAPVTIAERLEEFEISGIFTSLYGAHGTLTYIRPPVNDYELEEITHAPVFNFWLTGLGL
jgi:hypothetical protein